MKDCLVTQLKGTGNPELPILGALPIYVKPEGQCASLSIGSTPKTLVYPDGTTEQVSGDIISVLVPDGTLQKFQLMDSKYVFGDINTGSPTSGADKNTLIFIKTEDMAYMPIVSLTTARNAVPLSGNIANIFKYAQPTDASFEIFTRDDVEDLMLTGSDDDFKEFIQKVPNIARIGKGTGTYPTSYAVNFTLLAQYTNCQLTNILGGNLKGDIYPFIQKARLNNRTTGTLEISWFNKNNSVVVNEEEIPSEQKKIYGKFTWADNSITLLNKGQSGDYAEYKTWNI